MMKASLFAIISWSLQKPAKPAKFKLRQPVKTTITQPERIYFNWHWQPLARADVRYWRPHGQTSLTATRAILWKFTLPAKMQRTRRTTGENDISTENKGATPQLRHLAKRNKENALGKSLHFSRVGHARCTSGGRFCSDLIPRGWKIGPSGNTGSTGRVQQNPPDDPWIAALAKSDYACHRSPTLRIHFMPLRRDGDERRLHDKHLWLQKLRSFTAKSDESQDWGWKQCYEKHGKTY